LIFALENKNPEVVSALKKAGARGPDSAFSLKDGKVYKYNREIDGVVWELAQKTKGSARFWSVLDPESAPKVYFFSSEGAYLKFVPVEYESDVQDVIMSPGGGAFVLVGGSGMRPDVFFNVYSWEGAEKKAELRGMRGELEWFDEGRFAYTRIETGGVREGSFLNLAYGLRLSAAVYDVATKKETVLKEATETQNFYFSGLTDDGKNIQLTEEYVESPKDWGDEEKTKERKIKVPIPAAK